ncbi:MAG: SurA N-terminal domain-containing protein, partial [Clostridia bacterium]|nr:SurA N-terminal domain-containing protein [Clostridia bacterium]
MEWRRNPFFYTTLALAVVAAGLGVVAVRAAAPDVVATVNGQPITVDELYSELAAGPGRTVVDQLIARKLVEQEAAVRGVKVTDAEVDAELAGVRGNFASQEAFQQALAMSGIDEAGLREQIRFQMYLRKLLEPQVDLSDKALRAYFDQHKEDLGQREAVRLRGILVATEQEARA